MFLNLLVSIIQFVCLGFFFFFDLSQNLQLKTYNKTIKNICKCLTF